MKIVKNETKNEIVIEKSKFITHLNRVNTIEEANEYLNKIRKTYYDSSHNCYALVINNSIFKSSDDGEPSKTAGAPMLDILRNNKVDNTICVVTRYFGGVKLGTGGLVRAYSNSIIECLKMASFIKIEELRRIYIKVDYSTNNIINKFINDNCNVINVNFLNEVTYEIGIKLDMVDEFISKTVNLCNGKIVYEIGDAFNKEVDY